ncbi:hypothetical protein BUALT_Bualt16G0112500 [Buddleja alternifolia]|uniref:O-fucosyltransferase family protein n=1 Tax=Buddleja alternifolia TaxID=168488 RepID=A0AAV6WBG7_9LAMI|nr:hypothetical protein BUALT_Bualt16G0112500 [Buddleja alternifolia]
MAIQKTHQKSKSTKPRSPLLILIASIVCIAFLYLAISIVSTNGFSSSTPERLQNIVNNPNNRRNVHGKYLYWGSRIDCPGKHCDSCEGLGHQESSLRTFVMPSRICINPIHNKKGILHQSGDMISDERWAASSCAMDSLYDLDLISNTVPVIMDNSKLWHKSFRFMECKDRNNRSSIMLPYSFLPSMAAKKLQDAAEKIKALLGDYDAMHVRRGDKLKTRKDRFGVERTLHPHLDRDTRAEFILCRITKWVPPGRTLFIASNERIPGFFSPLAVRYKLAYSSNYSSLLDPLVKNNYQLFMIERLVMMGAKTFIRTFKEEDNYLSLTDDPKKNMKMWQVPVYTKDRDEC